MRVTVPVTAPVGHWRTSLVTWVNNDTINARNFNLEEPVYIIFNPFINGRIIEFIALQKPSNSIGCLSTNEIVATCSRRPYPRAGPGRPAGVPA